MNASYEATAVLLRLPAASLAALGAALESGTLRHGFSPKSLQPFCGDAAPAVEQALHHLSQTGFSTASAGILCQALGRALAERDVTERSLQLVLSGPEVVGTPVVDTKTTVLSLFQEAQQEVLITSYVFHQTAAFFSLLAQKHDADPAFRVTFIVDLTHSRKSPDDSIAKLAPAYAANFRKQHWPGVRPPEIWHDPRGFEPAAADRGILHAKTVIVDRKIAFITSANFTEAAQARNIEAGVLIRQARIAERLNGYFAGLISTNVLRRLVC
jgi:phosphatidylserine/phosphatidylglycerophosphate/cardiolipin synthase-like enzyme